MFIPSGFPFPLWNCRDRKPIYLGNENQDRFFHTVFAMNKYLVSVSLRNMAVLLLPPQSPRGLSALARLYYFVRPTKTAMPRRLGECRLRTLLYHFCHSKGPSIRCIFHLFKCKVISRLKFLKVLRFSFPVPVVGPSALSPGFAEENIKTLPFVLRGHPSHTKF